MQHSVKCISPSPGVRKETFTPNSLISKSQSGYQTNFRRSALIAPGKDSSHPYTLRMEADLVLDIMHLKEILGSQ
jgi:hypothetical protein